MLTLLMSTRAAQAFGADIDRTLAGRPWRLVDLDATPEADGNYAIDAAFLSRDVTGASGKTKLDATLERFYEIVRAAPGLQWLQAHSAGTDRPIYGELMQRGVRVTTASGASAVPVAQFAITGLLALARRLPDLIDSQRRRAWEPMLGPRAPRDLVGQTVVIVGAGPIGQEIARLADALRMHVIGVRRSTEPLPAFDEIITLDQLDDRLPTADWIVLACPLTDTTRGLMNAERLQRLPAGARIVNVARGEVIVESALVAALQSGHLGGAFIDVFEREPLADDSPLWTLPQVILTPHTAGHTDGHFDAVGRIFLDNLARFRDAAPLVNQAG